MDAGGEWPVAEIERTVATVIILAYSVRFVGGVEIHIYLNSRVVCFQVGGGT